MKVPKRSMKYILLGAGVAMLVLLIVIFAFLNERGERDHLDVGHADNGHDGGYTDGEGDTVEPDEHQVIEFMTDASEAHVLWQDGQRRIFVQNQFLYYAENEDALLEQATYHVIYEWDEALPAKAWLNRSYVLIGTQISPWQDDDPISPRADGGWLAVHIDGKLDEKPKVILEEETFYGPDEVHTMTIVPDPELFFMTIRNGEYHSEHVFHASHAKWSRLNYSPEHVPVRDDKLRYFANTRELKLDGGVTLYCFDDERGTVVYYESAFGPVLHRYFDDEVIAAQAVTFMESPGHVMVRLKNKAGTEWMAFMGDSLSRYLPLNLSIWDGGWQAWDAYTFTKITSDTLQVVKYEEQLEPHEQVPQHTSFALNGASLLSAQGSLLTFEINGEKRYVS